MVVGCLTDHNRWWLHAGRVDLATALLLLFAFGAAVASGLAALAVYQSSPVRLVSAQQALTQDVQELRAAVESLRVTWSKYRAELEGLLEAVEDTLENTERKRRKAAAAASKLEAPEAPQVADELVLRRRAREAGLPV